MLGLRVEVSSIALRRDLLFSFAPVVLSEGNSPAAIGNVVSPRSIDDRARNVLTVTAFGEEFAPEVPSEFAAEEVCLRAEGFLFGQPVSAGAAAGEATSPGLAVAPAVPVTSVPVATAVRGPELTQ